MGIYINGLKRGKRCPANVPFSIEETKLDETSTVYEIYKNRMPGSNMELLKKFTDQDECYKFYEAYYELLAYGNGPD